MILVHIYIEKLIFLAFGKIILKAKNFFGNLTLIKLSPVILIVTAGSNKQNL